MDSFPSATDANEAANLLVLPSRCVERQGINWYTPGVQAHHPCPEVLKTHV